MFTGATTAANAGVPPDKAGLAAALLNASQQLGGALGIAIFTAIATSHTQQLVAIHTPPAEALAAGFPRALLAAAGFLIGAALIALRATIREARGFRMPRRCRHPCWQRLTTDHRPEGFMHLESTVEIFVALPKSSITLLDAEFLPEYAGDVLWVKESPVTGLAWARNMRTG